MTERQLTPISKLPQSMLRDVSQAISRANGHHDGLSFLPSRPREIPRSYRLGMILPFIYSHPLLVP